MAEVGSLFLQALERMPGVSQSLDTLDEIPYHVDNAHDLEIMKHIMGILLTMQSLTFTEEAKAALDRFYIECMGRIYNLGVMRGQKPTDWRKILLTGKETDDDEERPEPDCGA